MFLRNLLFRDPSSDAAGAAAPAATPAQAPASQPAAPQAAPAMVGPAAYGGSTQFRDWEDPYKDPKFIAQFNSQPPSDGNKTPSAPGAPGIGEGGLPAQPTAGQPDPNASPTAADANGQAPAEASKGALSAEDKTYWSAKDPAFKDLPDHPAVAKMSQSYRTLETAYSRGQEHVKLVNQNLEDFKTIVQSGDPAEIAKMVEHFGGDVQFEARKPEDIVNEMKQPYQDILAVLKQIEHELPAEAIPVLNRALAAYAGHVNGKIEAYQGKQERKAELRKEIARITGVQTPTIGNPYERYKEPAKANMNILDRELQAAGDSNFWRYYEAIRPYFLEGGILHAQGITVGKAFGASPESARHYMSMAKGLWLSQNMDKEVVPKLEQSWLAKQKGNAAVTPPPQGPGAVAGAAARQQDPMIAKMERDMEQHMNRRKPIGV